jgi:undecaprenyl-diphosphatase
MEWLNKIDTQLLQWINQTNSEAADSFMLFMSAKWVWLPLYALLIWLLILKDGVQVWKTLIVIFFIVLLADQTASALFKPLFGRLRPCHEASLADWIRTPGGCGGKFGFVSSHAANTAGVALFLWKYMRNTFRYLWLLFLWASITAYSRVYLGVHYPGDVAIGALVGMFYGWVGLKAMQYWKGATT